MNTVMKNQVFNWSRFTLALRKEVVENWRQLVLAMVVLYAVLTLLMVLGNWISGGDNDPNSVHLRYMMVFICFSVSCTIMASLSFRGLMTKTSRTELFTSPSSMAEKFAVNVLIYVVGYIVAFFVVAQLADLTRVALLWPARSDDFIVPGPINFLPLVSRFISNGEMETVMGNIGLFRAATYVGLIASPGLYVLGSVLWPKLSFLKTFAAVYVIEMVIFVIGMMVMRVFDIEDVAMRILNNIKDGTFATFMLVATVVQLVLYWVLAWVVFCRKDVVSRGMFH